MSGVTLHTGENCGFVENKDKKEENENSQKFMPKNKFSPSKKSQTIYFEKQPRIVCGSSLVSEKEAIGPIGKYFDIVTKDPKLGEEKFENAEIKMLKSSIDRALTKANFQKDDIDIFLAGDLLNQITTSSYVARELNVPYLGLYSACSTMTESLAIGASMINAGYCKNILCSTVSHFATAERQFRYPLEYGSQRPPYAQWTVTGAGSTILSSDGNGPRIVSATIGKVVDFGISDIGNMGAAMAPAAVDTLLNLFRNTGTSIDDYDLILSGDLGKLGSDIMRDLIREQGIELGQKYFDCGALIYDSSQNCYQGGSGCGCSAVVFNSFILEKIKIGEYKKIVFLATGALMSPQSTNQGETIPSISHAIVIEA